MDNQLQQPTDKKKCSAKIEDSLLIRDKLLKRKIEALRLNHEKEQKKLLKSSPTINPKSRLIAKKLSQSQTIKDLKPKEFHLACHFLPRKASISLEALKRSKEYLRPLPKSYNLMSSSSKAAGIISFPSIESLLKPPLRRLEVETDFPTDIIKRNDLIKSLKNEAKSPKKQQKTPSKIHERSQVWLQVRNKKISEKQYDKQSKESGHCTFRPKIIKNREISISNKCERTVTESSYVGLYKRKKSLTEKNCKSDRNLSKETRTATAQSVRISSNTSSHVSPQYSSISPVKMMISDLSQFNRIKRIKPK